MKKLLTFFLAASMVASSFAGSISRGGGSFSRSVSSPARSIGMSRPTVTRPATSPSYAPGYSTPRPTTTPTYSGPAPMAAATHAPVVAPSTGSTFLSSMGGSFVGSWLGSSIGSSHGGGTTVVNNGGAGGVPGGAVLGGVPGAAGPVVVAQAAPSFSLAGFLANALVCILLAAAIGGLVWFLWGLVKSKRREMQALAFSDSPQDLPFGPISRFLELQRAFASKDTTTIRAYTTSDLGEQLVHDLPAEATSMTLKSITYDVLDVGARVLSIRHTAIDTQDDTLVDEVWHYTKDHGTWLLAGIEVGAEVAA